MSMLKKQFALKAAIFLVAIMPALARADIIDAVQIHGFVSQGYLISDRNDFLAHTEAGSFEFNEIGLNFNAQLTTNLRFGIQLFSRDLGPLDNNSIDLDWAFADYHWKDYLGIRVGRFKTPSGLYNDTMDLDMVRTTVFLPFGTYDPRLRSAFLSVNGIDAYGNIPIHHLGSLDYSFFFGTTTVKSESLAPVFETLMKLDSVNIDKIFGGRIIWNTPLRGLLVGGSYYYGQNFEAKGDLIPSLTAPIAMLGGLSIYPAGTKISMKSKEDTNWFIFTEYQYKKFTFAAEFNRMKMSGNMVTDKPFDPFVGSLIGFSGIPSVPINRGAWYGQVNYQFFQWLTAAVTYGEFYADWNHRSGDTYNPKRNGFQKDTTLSLRFDINQHWNVKMETHFMDGTGLLNLGEKQTNRHWNLYALKTSVYF